MGSIVGNSEGEVDGWPLGNPLGVELGDSVGLNVGDNDGNGEISELCRYCLRPARSFGGVHEATSFALCLRHPG